MQKMISFLIASCLLLVTGSAYARIESQTEINKKNVIAFYNVALNEKNIDEAVKYMGPRYIQHNPLAADGVEGFKQYIAYLRDKFPQSHNEIKRVFAEGDYVILHVNKLLEPNTKGYAIVDIFRLENDKIVEHWDVIQAVPETSANDNGMF